MAQLITESLIVFETVNDDGSSEIALTAQTEPEDGQTVSLAVFTAQAILSLFDDGTVLQRVNDLMSEANPGIEQFEMREVQK